MDRIDQVIEIAKTSNQMPLLLSFLMGVFVVSRVEVREEEILGDNVPTSLIEGLGG